MTINIISQLRVGCKRALPAVVAVALVGCGGSSSNPDQSEGALKIGTHPVFDPIARELPLNTDLLFADAAGSDGTANVGVPTNPAEAAINVLDGFSTTAYFDIAFTGGSIDADTVVACQLAMLASGECAAANVFVLALDSGGNDALDPANIVGVDTGNLPAFEASVVSLDGGVDNVLRIAPLDPLQAKTKYLVFLTNGIKDTAGQPITPSSSYHVLGEDTPELLPDLQAVRGAIQGWESIAAQFLNGASGGAISLEQARDSVAISYTFTTTDPVAPLLAMAAPRPALVQAQVQMGVPAENAKANADALEAAGLLSTPKPRNLDISPETIVDPGDITQGALEGGIARIYTGFIELPYYQTAPVGGFDPTFLQKSWTADDVLGAQLGEGLPPMDVDGSLNVTYRYPFAKQTGIEQVPLQLTLPNPDTAPAVFQPTLGEVVEQIPGIGGLLGGITEALSLDGTDPGVEVTCADLRDGLSEDQFGIGYPVVVFVHGITLDRSASLVLSHTLASLCVASVAIDLPMHGVPGNSDFLNVFNVEQSQLFDFAALYPQAPNLRERHFNLVQDAAGNPAPMKFGENAGELDGSGAWFINLGNLPNVRDNLRQSVMDLLNLNASLAGISELDERFEGNSALNLDKVSLVGVSLGGIVGTTYAGVNELARVIDAESNLNPLAGFVMSAGGGQLSQVLNASETIGPRVQAGLAASGVEVGSSNYERFLYVAQSTIESGDPVNFAGLVAQSGLPTVVQQIIGGGDATASLGDDKVYTADKVVPNFVVGAPLAGTTPLARLMAAQQVGGPESHDAAAQNLLVNLTIGHHGSLLRPNEDSDQAPTAGELLAIAELQTHVATLALTAGGTVQVGMASDGENENVSAEFVESP